jgi:V8-like Glu-specific endopeptidase
MTLYTGGAMIKSGYTWTNPTATSSVVLSTTNKLIYEVSTSPGTNGAPLGYMEYNVVTGNGSIDIIV